MVIKKRKKKKKKKNLDRPQKQVERWSPHPQTNRPPLV